MSAQETFDIAGCKSVDEVVAECHRIMREDEETQFNFFVPPGVCPVLPSAVWSSRINSDRLVLMKGQFR